MNIKSCSLRLVVLIIMIVSFQFGLLLPVNSYSTPKTLEIDQDQAKHKLLNYMEVLKDTNRSWTIKDVTEDKLQNKFTKIKDYSFGYTDSAYWVRIKIKNNSNKDLIRFLELSNSCLDKINLYLKDETGELISYPQVGDLLPFAAREIKHKNFIFKIPIQKNQLQTIYLRLVTNTSMFIPMTLWSPTKFALYNYKLQTSWGIYYGIMLAMIIYNSFIFFFTREKSYLYYVLFVASIALFQLVDSGAAYQHLWPIYPGWNNKAPLVVGLISILMLIVFSQEFLKLKANNSQAAKLLFYFKNIVIVIILFIPFIASDIIVRLSFFILILVMLILLWEACFSYYKQGYSPAKYFLFSFILLFLGGVASLTRNQGLLPTNFITRNGIKLGSTIQVFLLSFGISNFIGEIEEKATKDGLTELLNRDTFLKQAKEEFKPAKQQDVPLSLVMLDIDYFKQVNDNYGHLIGDQFLQFLAQQLRENTRAQDIVGRWGGEEFVIALPKTDLKQAKMIAERLRAKIEDNGLMTGEHGLISCTISLGISTLTDKVKTIEELIIEADKALYRAKEQGRNRVEVFTDK